MRCATGRITLTCVTDRGSERSAAWGVLAVVCLAAVTAIPAWIQVVSARTASVLWIAIAAALTLIAAVGLVMCFASLGFGWRIPLPRRRRRPSPPVRGLGRGLGALIPVVFPLEMRLEDEEWELFEGWIWIAALKIRMSNHTFLDWKTTIRLKRFSLDSDLGSYTPPKPTQEQADAVFRETMKRAESYSSHIKAMDLEPNDSVSGWYVYWVSLAADGGRPPCTFVATDSAGDTYELPIPARGRQSHRMTGGAYRKPDDDPQPLSG